MNGYLLIDGPGELSRISDSLAKNRIKFNIIKIKYFQGDVKILIMLV